MWYARWQHRYRQKSTFSRHLSQMQWYTLIELLLVLLVIGVLLASTMYVGWWYLHQMRFTQEKQQVMSFLQRSMLFAKTSNSWQWRSYNEMEIDLRLDAIQVHIDEILWDEYTLSAVRFMSPAMVHLVPYQRHCEVTMWSDYLVLASTVGDYRACFQIESALCKLVERPCP